MPRILVIDDVSEVRSAITIGLRAYDYEVLAVENGRLGLSEFDRSRFDLAIVDIFMMEMDGVTLIRELRARVPHLPIVIITGGDDGRAALEYLPMMAEMSGITRLQKPFRPIELVQAMHKAFHNAAQHANDV